MCVAVVTLGLLLDLVVVALGTTCTVCACLAATTEDRLSFYDAMLKQYPRSHLVKRKRLIIATGEL